MYLDLYLWLTVVSMILLYYLNTRRRFYRLASKIPGPTPLPFIGNVLEVLPHVKHILDKVCSILETHRGIAAVWIGNDLNVFISEPEYLEVFFNSSKMLDKSIVYTFMEPTIGQGLFTANGETWKQHRSMYTPTFNTAVLRTFIPTFQRQSFILVDVIRKEVGGPAFNVLNYLNNCAMDNIVETTLSYQVNSQTKRIPELEGISTAMDIIYKRAFKLYQYPTALFNILPDGRKHNAIIKDIRAFADEGIRARRQSLQAQTREKQPGDNDEDMKAVFMDFLLRGHYTDEEIRDHALTMAVTGFDAPAAALGFVLTMLGIHQDIQDKVYEEVSSVQEHINNRPLEAQDLDRLQYMELVIKETLRLFPIGPIIFRKLNDDVQFGSYVVPRGANVACAMIRTHRDPNIYSDPLKFNPDNFLEENMEKRHPYAYVPFSSGPRNCIGMKYAMMSMKIILINLLTNYKIICNRKMGDLVLKAEITMKLEGGFPIQLQYRQKFSKRG